MRAGDESAFGNLAISSLAACCRLLASGVHALWHSWLRTGLCLFWIWLLELRYGVGLFLLVEDGSCTKALDLVSDLERLGGEVLYNNGSARVFVTADGRIVHFSF